MGSTVRMKITRSYPRGGKTYLPGEPIEVPEAVARAMEAARPPYGRRLPEVDATSRAQELAAEGGLDLASHAGEGSGPDGRIYVEDVQRWLSET